MAFLRNYWVLVVLAFTIVMLAWSIARGRSRSRSHEASGMGTGTSTSGRQPETAQTDNAAGSGRGHDGKHGGHSCC